MASGVTVPLVFAAALIALIALPLALRLLPAWLALIVVLIKVGVPVVYFAFFYDGTWTFLDDRTYWEHGMILIERGYDPLSVLVRRDGLLLLFVLSLGPHVLYAWWNLLAISLLGPHYWAAVFLNVAVTFLAATVLDAMAKRGGFERGYRYGLVVFFLLHWELLTWTSFVSLKDVLVFTLCMLALYLFIPLMDRTERARHRMLHVAGIGAVLLILPWLRFYMSAVLLATLGAWLVIVRLQGWKRFAVFALAAFLALVVLPALVPRQYITLGPIQLAVGFIKSILTPRPWALQPEYTFLALPAALHWLFFPATVVGAYLLWRRSTASALVVLFVIVVMALNAMTPTFQGPRHRVQVTFGIAWMQFHALYVLVRAASAGPVSAILSRRRSADLVGAP